MIHFNFPPDVIRAFTQGDCNFLAWTLHAKYGYPLVHFFDEGDPYWWTHFACELPDRAVFDIKGIYSFEAAQHLWGDILVGDSPAVFACADTVRVNPRQFPSYDLDQYAEQVHLAVSAQIVKRLINA